ncbi:hypothetical protein V5R04_15585 [Jonesiaceae bacterium BS-20]|uniref:Uncharacterized protein n=1 Tax=Jonesiaceae bacterium BS-20 TaxID=3120821 RepID=A0AAU7DTV8_9MICO
MSENMIIRNGIRYREEDAIKLGFIKPGEVAPTTNTEAEAEAAAEQAKAEAEAAAEQAKAEAEAAAEQAKKATAKKSTK